MGECRAHQGLRLIPPWRCGGLEDDLHHRRRTPQLRRRSAARTGNPIARRRALACDRAAAADGGVARSLYRLSLCQRDHAVGDDTKVGVPGHFVGLQNFREIWTDSIFRIAVWNTCVYTAIATIFKLALGLWLALLLNRHFRGKP